MSTTIFQRICASCCNDAVAFSGCILVMYLTFFQLMTCQGTCEFLCRKCFTTKLIQRTNRFKLHVILAYIVPLILTILIHNILTAKTLYCTVFCQRSQILHIWFVFSFSLFFLRKKVKQSCLSHYLVYVWLNVCQHYMCICNI